MTAPRRLLRGATYLITRRCVQRQYLLRPSDTLNDVFSFVLAVAAERFGMRIHAYCVMSNHYHLVLTDPDARLPEFSQLLHALVARAMNAALGRWESFWAPSSYSAVALIDREDIVDKAAYVLANPSAAFLVASGREWPGLWSAPERIGAGPSLVARPEHFFSRRGALPEAAALELSVPPGFESRDAFVGELTAAWQAKEAAAVEERARSRAPVLGVRRVLALRPSDRPTPGERRRGLNPRIACLDPGRRVEALWQLRSFVHAYRDARARWIDGVSSVVFPEGTYLLRVAFNVCCAQGRAA